MFNISGATGADSVACRSLEHNHGEGNGSVKADRPAGYSVSCVTGHSCLYLVRDGGLCLPPLAGLEGCNES